MNITVNIPRVDIHVTQDPAIASRLDGLAASIAELKQQGAQLIMANAEHTALFDEINAALGEIVASEEAQDLALAEIATDLDALIAESTSPEMTTRLEELRAKTQAVASASEAQTANVRALAAKNDQPVTETTGTGNSVA